MEMWECQGTVQWSEPSDVESHDDTMIFPHRPNQLRRA